MVVVEVDHMTAEGMCDVVVVDNDRGAYQATRHLIELGHRRIGLVVGEMEYTSASGRLQGYREALEEAGIQLDDSLVARTSYHPTDARETARTLLGRHPEMTAVFATNGPLALGVLEVLREGRQHIPRDISLVAFDDAPWMDVATPGITTVAQPAREIGAEAATMLLDRLAGVLSGRAEIRRLPTRLIRRGSTAPPRVQA
jgi:LacI family transcriptional regulator